MNRESMSRNRFSDHLLTVPHLMQALRRSIKGEKDNAKVNIAPKSAVAIVPPKKVCADRCLNPHAAPCAWASTTRVCVWWGEADNYAIAFTPYADRRNPPPRLSEPYTIMKPSPTKS